MKGKVRNFRLYNRALSAEEVALIALTDQTTADSAAAALSVVHADDVRGNLTLPTTGEGGTAVTWTSSAPNVVGADGIVHRPAGRVLVRPASPSRPRPEPGTATATRGDRSHGPRAGGGRAVRGVCVQLLHRRLDRGRKIYFAASRGNTALKWDEVNNGQPVLESTKGTLGLRDPFLIRWPEGDRFFLIATDLSIGRNGDWDAAQRKGSRYLEVWESTDLVTWSEQRHVLVSPETAGNTWAPEAYWDHRTPVVRRLRASKLYAANDPEHQGRRTTGCSTRRRVTSAPSARGAISAGPR